MNPEIHPLEEFAVAILTLVRRAAGEVARERTFPP